MKKMKSFLFLIIFSLFTGCASTSPTTSMKSNTPHLEKLWELKDPAIQNPESTYYDETTQILFVSNVSGAPTQKDKKGWISKVNPTTGKLIKGKWIQGLNAPKGLRAYQGTLWVTDIDQVVSIDIKKGKIKNRISIPDAKFLNDIAISAEGDVYVSDMVTGTLFVIKNGKASVYAKDADSELPNGLLIQNEILYIASWGIGMNSDFSTQHAGRLIAYDIKTKLKAPLSKNGFGNLDGIESDGYGNFYISDWRAGKVYWVSAQGEPTLLLQEKPGTADLGYISASKTLLVPLMNEDSIKAFRVKQE